MNSEEKNTPVKKGGGQGPGGISPSQAPTASSAYKAEILVSTNTVVLSRKKFEKHQIQKKNVAPPVTNDGVESSSNMGVATVQPPLQVAKRMTEEKVYCPGCNADFEIEPAFYGQEAECSECGIEFRIPPEPTVSKKSELIPKAPTRKNVKPGVKSPRHSGAGVRSTIVPPVRKRGLSKGVWFTLILFNAFLFIGAIVLAILFVLPKLNLS